MNPDLFYILMQFCDIVCMNLKHDLKKVHKILIFNVSPFKVDNLYTHF
jgi:hypothetical protein